ncbi:MAG: glutathione peroxidase [Mariniblastus sp.]|nr:glutathione peroxidase [Mariniblastus sp.]
MNLRKMQYVALWIGIAAYLVTGVQAQDEAKSEAGKKNALDFKVKSIDGQKIDLSKYTGKVVVVVNTASKCGLTPQYAGLQKLYDQHSEKGLVVLGFPCNQFGRQEPGTESEIKTFCTENYGVAFPMFSKVDVNGEGQSPFYKNLCQLDLQPKGPGKVQWNFEKFVIDRQGQPVARFSPRTKPNDPEFQKVIQSALAK